MNDEIENEEDHDGTDDHIVDDAEETSVFDISIGIEDDETQHLFHVNSFWDGQLGYVSYTVDVGHSIRISDREPDHPIMRLKPDFPTLARDLESSLSQWDPESPPLDCEMPPFFPKAEGLVSQLMSRHSAPSLWFELSASQSGSGYSAIKSRTRARLGSFPSQAENESQPPILALAWVLLIDLISWFTQALNPRGMSMCVLPLTLRSVGSPTPESIVFSMPSSDVPFPLTSTGMDTT
ncbi:hypothetical protein JTB14_022142 [Gonioctena quinquepunctata]|nr:hypothetical protein JTB14_022142 [Gonioctena quinquepunctata]